MAQGPHDFIDPNKKFPNSLHFMENSILAVLQGVFSAFVPKSDSYHYSDDEAVSEIRIEGQNTDNLRSVDTRPKIVVARGPVQMTKTGINNFVGSANLSEFKRDYSVIRSGTIGISCYSRSDMEADRLAELCADVIESLAPVIRKLGYLEVRTQGIGQRAMIKADAIPELFVTPVLIKVQLTKNYKVGIVDPVKLRTIAYEYLINPVGLKIPPS